MPTGFRICEQSGSDRVLAIYQSLCAGRPVGAAFHIFPTDAGRSNFENSGDGLVKFSGNDCPPEGGLPPDRGGHAVCIVGFEPDQFEPMGGYFVFRNSFGTAWPTKGPIDGWPGGYGRIAASDVGRFLWEALFMP